jgi:hypothetical protein
LCGLAFTLIHCSVESPSFSPSSRDGIRESICSQRALSAPARPRFGSSHQSERSTNSPLERITPPSFVSKNWNGLLGLVAIACWSGWSPFGCSSSVPSNVMSVPDTPASVDRITARLFAIVSP